MEYPNLIDETPNVVDLMTQGKMKFNSIIVQCAVVNPDLVIPLLMKFNRGVFGGFIVRQTFNSILGYYTGRGTFSGMMDGVRFTMYLKDHEVRKITVENMLMFIERSSTFRQLIDDMNLQLSSRPGHGLYFDGYRMTEWDESCCEIEEGPVINNYVKKTVRMTCDKFGKIRIITDESRPITILSFTPSVKYTTLRGNYKEFPIDMKTECWVWDRSLDKVEGYRLISDGTTSSELNEWIVTSFLKRLESKGFQIRRRNEYVRRASPVQEQRVPEVFFTDGMTEDEMLDLVLELNSDASSMSDADFDYNDLVMESDDYIVGQEIRSRNELDSMGNSVFWDRTISHLIELSSFNTIERACQGDEVLNPSVQNMAQFIREVRQQIDI